MNASVRTALWLGLVLVLAACSSSTGDDGSSQGNMTPDQMNAVVNDFKSDGEAMRAEAEASVAFQALGSMPPLPPELTGDATAEGAEAPGPLQSTADHPLPRAHHHWDGSDWSESPAETLIVTWAFEDDSGAPRDAKAEIDWEDGDTPTVDVAADAGGSATVEAPRAVRGTFEVDGAAMGELRGEADWRDTASCGAILQPTRLFLDGSLGDATHDVAFEELSVELSDAGTVDSSGDVVATAGSESMSFGWDVSLAGAWTTDAEDCFWTGFDPASGSVDLSISTNGDGAGLSFDFANVQEDADGNVESVDFSGGRLDVGGTTAVTFEGTLDQPAGDDVPGANLQLHFDGETMTLKEYLEGDLGITRVTLGALSALRLAF